MDKQINCDWKAALLEHLLGRTEHENEIQSELKNAPVLIGYESIGCEQLSGSVGQIKFKLTNVSPNRPTRSFKSIFSYTAPSMHRHPPKVWISFKLSNSKSYRCPRPKRLLRTHSSSYTAIHGPAPPWW